jgi:phospholipid/cholesterol/gamma-HCH transport system substrate-binding protein
MPRKLLTMGVIVVLAAAIGAVLWRSRVPTRTLVANFAATVGVNPGSDVRVLGVKVGDVVSVTPQGRTVRVVMRYAATVPVPADTMAVIVPPSVVSDRYVQLTPAYSGGPTLPDNADLPQSRTAVPLELDDVYRALDQFNQALGPNGANAGGALSQLVHTGASNLDGNGTALGGSIAGLSQVLSTLDDGRDDLFGTVADLQKFVTALAQSDDEVRRFNDQLATVGAQLAGERDELAAVVRDLATALADITAFLHDNRTQLTVDVSALTDVSGVLVRQQQAIVDVLNVAPLALSDLNLAYNARSGTLDTRDDALGPYDPASYVCSLLVGLVTQAQVPKECVALAQTLNARHLPLTDQLRKLLGLPPVKTSSPGGTPGTPGTAPGSGVPGLPAGGSGDVLPNDPTLGGILRGLP